MKLLFLLASSILMGYMASFAYSFSLSWIDFKTSLLSISMYNSAPLISPPKLAHLSKSLAMYSILLLSIPPTSIRRKLIPFTVCSKLECYSYAFLVWMTFFSALIIKWDERSIKAIVVPEHPKFLVLPTELKRVAREDPENI